MFDLAPLRETTFRNLAVAYWVNEFGNWMGEIALAILVFDRTRSPLATALLFLALRFFPALLAPVLATRFEALRPRLMLPILYLLEAIFFAGMALVADHFSFPAILALCTLDGVLAITAKALTRGVNATWLLKHDQLRAGNAILNIGVMAGSAAGPALAGLAVAWKGPAAALLIDAGSFLVVAGLIVLTSGLRLEADKETGFSGRLRTGASLLRTHLAVRRLLVAIALVMLVGSIPIPIEVVFAKQTLHAGDHGYGFLLGAWGIGMIVGGWAFGTYSAARLLGLVGVGTALAVLGYAGLAASPTLAIACCFSALGGSGNGVAWIAAVTSVQERTPVKSLSQVMAVLEGINQLMPAVGFVIGGAITAASSPRMAYLISAVGVVLVVILIAARPIDRVRLSEVPDGADNQSVPDEPVSRLARNSSITRQEVHSNTRTIPLSNG